MIYNCQRQGPTRQTISPFNSKEFFLQTCKKCEAGYMRVEAHHLINKILFNKILICVTLSGKLCHMCQVSRKETMLLVATNLNQKLGKN